MHGGELGVERLGELGPGVLSRHLVAGTAVVADGESVSEVFPGQAIISETPDTP
jgi:hypothetical protein